MSRNDGTNRSHNNGLPVHPAVAARLLEETLTEPDNEVLLRKTIALDPALTLAIYRHHSNLTHTSSDSGPSYRMIVERLTAPVCRFAAINAIVSAPQDYAPSGAHKARWRRALARSFIARSLAGASQRVDPETASLAALLFDAGGLVDPDRWKQSTIELLEMNDVPSAILEMIRRAHESGPSETDASVQTLLIADDAARHAMNTGMDMPDPSPVASDIRPSRWERIVSDAMEDAEQDLPGVEHEWGPIRERAIHQMVSMASAAFEEVDALKASTRELSKQVATDALTGVYSRLAFTQRFAEELERARRDGLPLTLMLLDIDSFKPINDTYGHPAGDAYLTATAGVLQSCARRIDVVARYGGEEFVVILPHTNLSGAEAIGERLRQSVESLVVEHEGRQIRTTASIGSCTVLNIERGRMTCERLIELADRQLYVAKRSGKNRVEHEQIDDHFAAAG